MKTVKFLTLGCKANQYDTQVMREALTACGLREVPGEEKAGLYVVNTCTVTGRADSQSRNLISSCRHQNPKAKIIVTGCYAELEPERIVKIPGVSCVLRNSQKQLIPFFARKLTCQGNMDNAPKAGNRGISYFKGHTRAFLKVQDGCDKFCSYCRVPLARGRSRSRPTEEVVAEAKRLVRNGYKEIVLTGICLGSFGRDLVPEKSVVELVSALEKIKGLYRIRLSSIEPEDVSPELIKKMSVSKKLCRHLHIPLQSGDDKVLAAMNRKYRRADFSSLINKLRRKVSGIGITTDCLVGFPTEKEENFRNTLGLVRKIRPLRVHVFPYSGRPGTAAAKISPQVPPEVIKERAGRLRQVADVCAQDFLRAFRGKQLHILCEEQVPGKRGFWKGYSDNYIPVVVRSDKDLRNKIVKNRGQIIKLQNRGQIIKTE